MQHHELKLGSNKTNLTVEGHRLDNLPVPSIPGLLALICFFLAEYQLSPNKINSTREPDVALLMTPSSLFDIFLTIVRNETFSEIFHLPDFKAISNTRNCINSNQHVIKEKIQTFICYCLKLLILLKNAHVR